MNKLIVFLLLFISTYAYSQSKEAERILEEGKLLYRLEKGSWHGTDHFLANFDNLVDSIGGYLSYETPRNKINTIFYSKSNVKKVLVRYTFDTTPTENPIKLDTTNHEASNVEQSLIELREDAADRAYTNKDRFFTFYENASLNFIPLIKGSKRKVFVLTGPKEAGFVLIGNDYELVYNKKGDLKRKNKIHHSLLQFPFTSGDKEAPMSTSYHSHITTPYISSTDICTLLLYKDYVEWKQHIVVSDKRVTIFDLEKETLFTMKRKAWDRMNKNLESKK